MSSLHIVVDVSTADFVRGEHLEGQTPLGVPARCTDSGNWNGGRNRIRFRRLTEEGAQTLEVLFLLLLDL
jgi:hypothetical protein